MSRMTNKDVRLLAAFVRLVWQSVFSAAVLIAFFVVLYYLINASSTFEVLKYGSIQVFLAGTVYLVFKFYFPARNSNQLDNDENI